MRVPATPPTYRHSCFLFLRALGLVYLIAFYSLWIQLPGLVGHHGILPADFFLTTLHEQLGSDAYWLAPTLCWLNPSDSFRDWICLGGMLASVLLVAGVMPAACLAALWAFYLSLMVVGQEFLAFQWDALLLEAGFLAIFVSPLRWRSRPGQDPEPPRLMVHLLWWLLFRLILSSGIVKILSQDPTWRDLSALSFHYETQPLPNPLSWYVHQLPGWFHRLSVVVMFGLELIGSFLFWGSRTCRILACGAQVGLQLLIAATGNYAFFNGLTIALCLPLLDDRLLQRAPLGRRWQVASPCNGTNWSRWVIWPIAALVGVLTAVPMLQTVKLDFLCPQPVRALYRWVSPFNTFNSYGLFAVMTTERPEIIVEGSRDGVTWQPYEFKFKPGDPLARPSFVAPYQPRLDWQMWFAALGHYRNNPWFLKFCWRLLEGRPEVLGLLAGNPFPDVPPSRLRAVVYDYRFTNASASSAWWRRQVKYLYCPVLSSGR
ncbi:MAG: lipase maturation factor family protein [Acidobacteriota bacterium]